MPLLSSNTSVSHQQSTRLCTLHLPLPAGVHRPAPPRQDPVAVVPACQRGTCGATKMGSAMMLDLLLTHARTPSAVRLPRSAPATANPAPTPHARSKGQGRGAPANATSNKPQATNNKQRAMSNEHHEPKLAFVLAIAVTLGTLNHLDLHLQSSSSNIALEYCPVLYLYCRLQCDSSLLIAP